MLKKTLHILLLFTVLFGVWYVLSGVDTPLFYIFGLISSTLVTIFSLRMQVIDNESHPFHLVLTVPFYWLWLFKEMLVSGWAVTRIVWSPEPEITPCFAWVPISQSNDLGRTIYANSVTLTPGTVCVAIEDRRMFIHALESSSVPALMESPMDGFVTRLTRNIKSTPAQDKVG